LTAEGCNAPCQRLRITRYAQSLEPCRAAGDDRNSGCRHAKRLGDQLLQCLIGGAVFRHGADPNRRVPNALGRRLTQPAMGSKCSGGQDDQDRIAPKLQRRAIGAREQILINALQNMA